MIGRITPDRESSSAGKNKHRRSMAPEDDLSIHVRNKSPPSLEEVSQRNLNENTKSAPTAYHKYQRHGPQVPSSLVHAESGYRGCRVYVEAGQISKELELQSRESTQGRCKEDAD